MKAILSDVHANLEAFLAVLADIRGKGIDEVYNLGDTIGYGPNPLECLDLTMNLKVTLLGDHDAAVYLCGDDSPPVTQCLRWTKMQLDFSINSLRTRYRNAFLGGLRAWVRDDDILFIYGTVQDPIHGYMIPSDVDDLDKMNKIGDQSGSLTFAGRTHVPGLFLERARGDWEYRSADQCEEGYRVEKSKVICNVGSVGQPQDGNPRACYVTFDGEWIRFHRVEYPFERTIRKIHENPELENFHGNRLREGR